MRFTTLGDRIRNAIRAFKRKPAGSIQFGLDIKRCSECQFRSPANLPDFHDFDVGTDQQGTYFISFHNGYDVDSEEDGSALGVFTLSQIKSLISTLKYIIGEECSECVTE